MLDELRNHINIVEVIGRKVKLERRGRNHVGLCPFHNEKSPSFTVHEDKGFYHCFGCGVHGDAITFVMETEGLSFIEAVEKLAAERGLPSPIKRGHRHEERAQAARSLTQVMDAAVSYYEAQLQTAAGASARRYLEGRGLGDGAQSRFRIGFAPETPHGLKDHLTGLGIALEEQILLGLVIQPEDHGRGPFDRFRGRILFPIFDVRGRAIAFGGRTLKPDGVPKYLNSPETPLFHKGAVLFNHGPARAAAAKGASVIVAEGYVDVIALAVAGFEGAVAPLGTALTEDQLALLWRMADEPILCFDGDKAGKAAAHRAIDRALPILAPGKSLKIVLLPEGQDPDDLIRAQGRDAMAWHIDAARPLIDALWQREIEAANPTTPERVAGFRARLRSLASEIRETELRRDYADALQLKLSDFLAEKRGRDQASFQAQNGRRMGQGGQYVSRTGFNPTGRPGQAGSFGQNAGQPGRALWTPKPGTDMQNSPAAAKARGGPGNIHERREQLLILALINHPQLIETETELVEALTLTVPVLDKIRNELLHAAALKSPLDRQGLRDHLTVRGLGDEIVRMEQQKVVKSSPFVWPKTEFGTVRCQWVHAGQRHNKLTALKGELTAAMDAWTRDDSLDAAQRVRDLDRQIKLIEGDEAGPPDLS